MQNGLCALNDQRQTDAVENCTDRRLASRHEYLVHKAAQGDKEPDVLQYFFVGEEVVKALVNVELYRLHVYGWAVDQGHVNEEQEIQKQQDYRLLSSGQDDEQDQEQADQ